MLTRRTRLSRRTPLRAKLRPPTRRRDTGPTQAVRAWVIVRDQGRCMRCGTDLVTDVPTPVYEIQHRLPRGMGGTSSPAANKHSNLILLGGAHGCGCHAWVEQHRGEAYDNGWLVRRWQNPLTVPVLCARRGLILLDDNGEWRAA